MHPRLGVAAFLVLWCAMVLAAQIGPPAVPPRSQVLGQLAARDAAPPPAGTGRIRGRVTTTDSSPLRNAQITLTARSSSQGQRSTFFGFFGRPAATRLAPFDPATLAATSESAPIAEYHWHAAASPDGTRIAAAIGSPSIGSVRIVNVASMMAVTTKAGIAAEAVAWLDDERVVAALDCVPTNARGRGCGIVLIDARSGAIERRWPATEADAETLPFEPPLDPPKPVANSKYGVVLLLGHATTTSGALLALVTPGAELRSVVLDRIAVGRSERPNNGTRRLGPQTSAGLALNPNGDRAYVVGGESSVAEVDLQTLAVTYHAVPGLQRLGESFRRGAVWFGERYIATFGETRTGVGNAVTTVPDGVRLIDTTTWRAETVEARASRALVSDDVLIAYDGGLVGIEGIAPNGRKWALAAEDARRLGAILSVHAGKDQVFVVSRDSADSGPRISSIDVATGRIRITAQPDDLLVDLVLVR